jgi:hypothetical protein
MSSSPCLHRLLIPPQPHPEEARRAVSKGGIHYFCSPSFETPRRARLLRMRLSVNQQSMNAGTGSHDVRCRQNCHVGARSRPFLHVVILSAAKACPERSRRDLMPVASGDEVLRCAQDDRNGSHDACHPKNCHPERSEGPLPLALEVPRCARDDNDVGARSGSSCHADRGPPGPLMLMMRAWRPAVP